MRFANKGFTTGRALATGPVQIGPTNPAYSGSDFASGGNPSYNTYVDNYTAAIEAGGYTLTDTPGESFLMVGQGNVLSGSAYYGNPVQGTIIVGVNNTFEAPNSSFANGTAVFGGQNTISAGNGGGSLYAGNSNNIAANSSMVCLGDTNTTLGSTYTSQILGTSNTLSGTTKSVALGEGNDITGGWEGAVAIGYYNDVRNKASVAIGSGNTASGNRSYAIGETNYSYRGFILGGDNAAHGQYSAIVGRNNTCATGEYQRVMYGVGTFNTNTVNKDLIFVGSYGTNNATSEQASGGDIQPSNIQVLIGYRGEVQSPNSIVFSNVNANYDVGAMQEVKTFLSCETTDATPKVVESNIFPKSDSAMGFSYTVTARRTDVDGHNVYWTGSGLITNEAGTVAVIGSVSKVEVAKIGFASVDIAFTENTANDSLQLTVTGEAGESITWHAVVTQNIVVG